MQVDIVFYYLSDRGIKFVFDTGKSTVSSVVKRVCIAICNKLSSKLIQFWAIAICSSFLVIYLRDCMTLQQFIATSISSGFIGLIFSAFLDKLKITT